MKKLVKESIIIKEDVAEPTVKPGTKTPVKPKTPTPFRRIRPSVDPTPKAKLKKSSIEAIIKRYENLKNKVSK
jgi:hypothetical protein